MEDKLRAMQAPWHRGIEVLARIHVEGVGRCYIRRTVGGDVIHEQVESSTISEHTYSFLLRDDDAQTLMDDLWACGLRPTEGRGSAGSLSATQDHLKDMQRIAFNVLERVFRKAGNLD